MISNGRIFSATSVKVFPSPAGKTPVYLTADLELCEKERERDLSSAKVQQTRSSSGESFPSPSHKNKLQPIDVFHLHLSDKTRVFRSNLSTKHLYICHRVLFKETVDKLHSAYLCKDRSASWSMALDLVIQWKKTTCELV